MSRMKDYLAMIYGGGDEAVEIAQQLMGLSDFTVQDEPCWISASDRLPDDFGEDVLVFVFDNTEPELKYPAIGNFDLGQGWHVTSYPEATVTHWMPLPKPPKCATH